MPTVQFKDYYKTLDVPRGADEKSVRTAFRKLARKYHPDINPGDPEAEDRFKEINEAFEVLSDPEKRKLYDRFGDDWQRYRDAGFTGDEPASRSGQRRRVDPNDFGAWFAEQSASRTGGPTAEWIIYEQAEDEEAGFSDFFQTVFGSRARGDRRTRSQGQFRQRRQRGEDVEVPIAIDFNEAFRGAKRTIELQTPATCPTCRGTGLVREAPCPTCDGTGISRTTRTLEVTIPAGVSTGSRVRVAGQGGPGTGGGAAGDVYLVMTVRPDAHFERDGDDLRSDVDVPFTTAVLGGEAVVATPTGRVALNIPPETQSGRLFRLRGQGMPRLKGGKGARGDLLARVRVVVPTDLTDRERALVEELRAIGNEASK